MDRRMPYLTGFSVYMVENSITGKRYIGITKGTAVKRWREHVYAARGTRSGAAFHKAIRKYGENAFTVRTICVVGDENDVRIIERKLIEAFDTMIPHGYNLTTGGEGLPGFSFASEVKAEMSRTRRATPKTPAQIAALQRAIASNVGRTRSAEANEKARVTNLGRKHTPETRRKLSIAKKGKPQSPIQIARSAASRTGLPRSEAAKIKQAATMRGRKHTAEAKERMRKAKLGKLMPQSAETILAANQQRLTKASPGSKSGIRGVRQLSNGRWEANIKIARKSIYLGIFPDPEKAYAAYLAAAERRIKELESKL